MFKNIRSLMSANGIKCFGFLRDGDGRTIGVALAKF